MKNKVFRYFQTIKHLKPIQFIGRFNQYIPKKVPSSKNIPQKNIFENKWDSIKWKKPSMIQERRFKFLNEEKSINSKKDWNKKIQNCFGYSIYIILTT